MKIEIKESNMTIGQVDSLRELLINLFNIDFQVEIERDIVRFKDN